jgi:hypothetical protein
MYQCCLFGHMCICIFLHPAISDHSICTSDRDHATSRKSQILRPREYWVIYRGLGFLVVVWFGSPPTPFPPLLSASCLSLSVFLCDAGRAYWRKKGGRGWPGGRGAKSYDHENALPSINHLILSALSFVRKVHIAARPPMGNLLQKRAESIQFS